MKYVLYNIRNLARRETFIFAVMLICVFVSAWVMTFSYGLFYNYSTLLIEQDEDKNILRPTRIEGSSRLTHGEFAKYLSELSAETLDAMDMIHFYIGYGRIDEHSYTAVLDSFIMVRDGKYLPSQYIIDLWEGENMIVSGRYISDEEEANGERVIMDIEPTPGFPDDRNPELYKDDETMLLYGEEYKIVGTSTSRMYVVPFMTMPDDAEYMFFYFHFSDAITRKQYDDLVSTAERAVPGKFTFDEPVFVDEQTLMMYRNIIAVAALIAVLAIVNFAVLYSFILNRRSRTLAIMRICGCTKGRARLICLGECCIICMPAFLAGMLTYIPFMHKVLSSVFVYIEEAYSFAAYASLFAVFAAVLLIIMSLLLTRTIRRELAESRKGGAV